jgi:hypothetical protein
VAEYLTADHDRELAAVIYRGSFLAMSATFFVLQQHVLRAKGQLLAEAFTAPRRRAILRRNLLGLVPYALATAAALISPYLTLVLCALVAVYYALPVTAGDGPEVLGESGLE